MRKNVKVYNEVEAGTRRLGGFGGDEIENFSAPNSLNNIARFPRGVGK